MWLPSSHCDVITYFSASLDSKISEVEDCVLITTELPAWHIAWLLGHLRDVSWAGGEEGIVVELNQHVIQSQKNLSQYLAVNLGRTQTP